MTLFDGEVEPGRQPRTTPPVGVVERNHDAIRGKLSVEEAVKIAEGLK